MKRQLPKIRWTFRNNGNPQLAEKWFTEHHFRNPPDNSPEEPGSPTAGGDMRDLSHLVAPFDPEPRVGDIRLLSAEFTSRLERPVYAGILRSWEEDGLVTAIFSPYDFPALTTELYLPHRPHPLRTLCLWHHYVLPPELLAKSWLVDQLSDEELAQAWQVFRHAMTAEPLPAHLAGQVGTRVFSADDPRLVWQQEEQALLAPLAQAVLAREQVEEEQNSAQTDAGQEDFADWLCGLAEQLATIFRPTRALAAADLAPTTSDHPAPLVFEIEKVPFSLRFYPQPLDGLLTVLVTDANFEITKVFDGYYLVFGQADPVKVFIESGKASHKISPDESLAKVSFHTPDGRIVRTRPLP